MLLKMAICCSYFFFISSYYNGDFPQERIIRKAKLKLRLASPGNQNCQ